jgi:hypothetical protein
LGIESKRFVIPQLINIAIGLWLMAAPAVLGYGRPASVSDHVVGPLVATFACIALWEATRAVRRINLPLGLWAIVAPWALGAPMGGKVNGVLCGIAVAALSCFGGRIQQQFGGGWPAIWQREAWQGDAHHDT